MNNYTRRVRVGIAGFRGYSGAELVRLLKSHPAVTPVLLEHRMPDLADSMYIRETRLEHISPDEARDAGLEAVFLATPGEVSLELAPAMLRARLRVIDLSGAFRLETPERYARWYKGDHPQPRLLAEATYGLPEFYRDRIPDARLVANPGCYPTAANLAIRPLISHNLADLSAGIICDAKSGVSGAGRKPSLSNSFCEVAENFSAYAVLEHRHVPEVLMNSGLDEKDFSFTAQLIPISRGILETIYFRVAVGHEEDSIREIFARCYANEPFVRIHAAGSRPDIHAVAHTNFCDLSIHVDAGTGRGVIISAIDNLGKGAAGQAIQNMNLLFGFPETEGLL